MSKPLLLSSHVIEECSELVPFLGVLAEPLTFIRRRRYFLKYPVDLSCLKHLFPFVAAQYSE